MVSANNVSLGDAFDMEKQRTKTRKWKECGKALVLQPALFLSLGEWFC